MITDAKKFNEILTRTGDRFVEATKEAHAQGKLYPEEAVPFVNACLANPSFALAFNIWATTFGLPAAEMIMAMFYQGYKLREEEFFAELNTTIEP